MTLRRTFLKQSAVAAIGAALPGPRLAVVRGFTPPQGDLKTQRDLPDVAALARRAVDAARSAGAAYADVRLTREYVRSVAIGLANDTRVDENERLALGVRALANGAWGFAASSIWTPDEAVRLGREAVAQARIDASVRPRPVDLGPAPTVRDGHWVMPVAIDPFTMPVDEVIDFLQGLSAFTSLTPGATLIIRCEFIRTDKTFASSEGASWRQTTYNTSCNSTVLYGSARKHFTGGRNGGLSPAGLGWEYVATAPHRETIVALIAQMVDEAALPERPLDPGRYPVVFDAETMARIVDGTVGTATELDRAMGDEANASGTSYLDDPLAMVGTEAIGSPLVTITADRSRPGGVATVRWDDEGVEPEPFTLVQSGTLVDFQTTRESASWLAPYYRRANRALRSHGCAASASALDMPLGMIPNLTLAPERGSVTFDDLIGGISHGVAVRGGSVMMDYQALNGMGSGAAYEIRNGRRVARIKGAVYWLRAPSFWNSIAHLGGAESGSDVALQQFKGEPAQSTWHTVRAVPALARDIMVSSVAGDES